jgi:hypothetical protein
MCFLICVLSLFLLCVSFEIYLSCWSSCIGRNGTTGIFATPV